jgi:hypothetical protein
MKIEGPNRAQKAGSASRKEKVSGGDGSFGGMLGAGGAEAASQTAASQSIASVDSLLALQGAENPTERAARQRMHHRADNLLTELDRIRMALLTGNLTVGHVIGIADVVAQHREKILDPRLTAILDEIDLRAQIEIAKMRMALDNRA